MPRRLNPDPLSEQIGRRVRAFREQAGLTLERLAYESDLGSKGHVHDIEAGLVRPTVHTLNLLAERLGISIVDLLVDPEHGSDRDRLFQRAGHVPPRMIRRWLREAEPHQPPAKRPPKSTKPPSRAK